MVRITVYGQRLSDNRILPTKPNRPWGLRLRMWLVVIVMAAGIIKHRPLIAMAVSLLIVISGLNSYFTRRKQRRNA
jgi:hypothetical protein